MKGIAVFCGSAEGADPCYGEMAFGVGKLLAQEGIRVIYGGARVGLMGAVADGALNAGGEVTGIIPYFLCTKEIAHEGLTELIIVDSMHERKMAMHERSDGIIALPGGFGTMEELFEMLTWAQLGLHRKPIGVLNTAGYYDCLQNLVDTMMSAGFLSSANASMLLLRNNIDKLLDAMRQYVAPETPKWITERTT